jgi:L-lysine 2,3-aminomutase
MDKIDFALLEKLTKRQYDDEIRRSEQLDKELEELKETDPEEFKAKYEEYKKHAKKSLIHSIDPNDRKNAMTGALLQFMANLMVSASPTTAEKMKKRLEFLEAGGKIEDCEPLF